MSIQTQMHKINGHLVSLSEQSHQSGQTNNKKKMRIIKLILIDIFKFFEQVPEKWQKMSTFEKK